MTVTVPIARVLLADGTPAYALARRAGVTVPTSLTSTVTDFYTDFALVTVAEWNNRVQCAGSAPGSGGTGVQAVNSIAEMNQLTARSDMAGKTFDVVVLFDTDTDGLPANGNYRYYGGNTTPYTALTSYTKPTP